MGKVLFGLSVSLDGFIADKNDGVKDSVSISRQRTFPHKRAIAARMRSGGYLCPLSR